MLSELYGKVTGCCQGKGGSMLLVDISAGFLGAVPVVGSTIPIAVGTAFGSVMQNDLRVSLVFFGEGATEEGVFHESINFASLHRLPIVFVCENNFFSVYSPLSVRQPPSREIFELARGHGVESYQGDGNDVEAVHSLTTEAVNRAREGDGPTFLEFKTYRWREHCGPYYDNDLGYRTESEFLEWKQRDPIQSFQNRLLEDDGILSHQDITDMISKLEIEIDEAFTYAQESPFPEKELLLEHIYALQD
jgi:pyruvate dehydrogenase E1 component alpha subunit